MLIHLKPNSNFQFKKFNGRSLKTLIFRFPDIKDSQTPSAMHDAKIVKLFSQDAIGVLFGRLARVKTSRFMSRLEV